MTVSGWIARGKPGLMIWLEDRRTGIVIASQRGCTWKSLPPKELQELNTKVKNIEAKYNNCFVTVTGVLCRKVRQLKPREPGYFYFPVKGLKISTIKTAVYVTKRIPKGQIIYSDSLEERKFEPKNFGFDFVVSRKNAIGRKAKYDLQEGQILTDSYLVPERKNVNCPKAR
jgi:hypothetical protein